MSRFHSVTTAADTSSGVETMTHKAFYVQALALAPGPRSIPFFFHSALFRRPPFQTARGLLGGGTERHSPLIPLAMQARSTLIYYYCYCYCYCCYYYY